MSCISRLLTVTDFTHFLITTAEILNNVNSALITNHKQKSLCMVTTCLLLEGIMSSSL